MKFVAFLTGGLLLLTLQASSQTIGTFSSVQPTTQTQSLILPTTHTFQRILRSGTTLSSGETVGDNLDFTGYVPIGGSSANGYLSVSSETLYASVAILSLSLQPSTRLWSVNSGGRVPLPFSEIGNVHALCAGTVTPNNHVMVCEETTLFGDDNGDGYNDDGWIIEIDPATRTVINQDGSGGVDKLWAMGRQAHEDVVIKTDLSAAYWSADNASNGFVYKFIPTVPGNFSSGSLFVLKTNASLGVGSWEPVANGTPADRNNTVALSNAAGAYNFSRVEGIELGPDGKVYFASTTSGRIYRFRDLGTTIDQLEVFVESTNYDVDGAGPFQPQPWGTGADNLAFDGEGNLWVLQDGGNNYIWVVGAGHTAANPAVRLFAIMPAGSEPTGITFSPDYKYLFLSVQHPSSGNTASQTDAAGQNVVFDNSTTVVIARKENLGSVALPLPLLRFDATPQNQTVALRWQLPAVADEEFEIERSTDGVQFSLIGRVKERTKTFLFVDDKLPSTALVYYRLAQYSPGGRKNYSETKPVRLQRQEAVRLHPSPARDKLFVEVAAPEPVWLSLVNAAGMALGRPLKNATNRCEFDLRNQPSGVYYLVVETSTGRRAFSFVKQ